MMFSISQSTLKWAKSSDLESQYFETIDSTNTFAKGFAPKAGNKNFLIIADHQTHGRGRSDHTWSDRGAGSSLLSSWAFDLKKAPQPITTARVGLALYQAVATAWPNFAFSLKAPNDLFLEGQKVAGLLVETISDGRNFRLIIGLGFNITAHPDLPDATHLSSAANVTEQQWLQFLASWKSDLLKISQTSDQATLSENDRAQLLAALNKNPKLKEPFTQIDSGGSLKTRDSVYEWLDL